MFLAAVAAVVAGEGGGEVASHLGNADSLIIPSQVALPHLNGRLVLTFITIICQSVTSSSSSSFFFSFFFRHFLLSGPNELKQLYSKCPRRGRYSHSLTHQFVRSLARPPARPLACSRLFSLSPAELRIVGW